VAKLATQRKGESAHSPRSCIPGGGWEIKDLRRVTLGGGQAPGRSQHPGPVSGAGLGRGQGRSYRGQRVGLYRVNPVEIGKGEDRQLVYYWFQEQGRVLTNEHLAKLFLFWDALTRNRTGGALVGERERGKLRGDGADHDNVLGGCARLGVRGQTRVRAGGLVGVATGG
jgi:hypothetical protein